MRINKLDHMARPKDGLFEAILAIQTTDGGHLHLVVSTQLFATVKEAVAAAEDFTDAVAIWSEGGDLI